MGNALTCIERHREGWDLHHHVADPHRPPEATKDDMTQPLSHYFVSSGHNSYLTGNQLNSDSGTATIIACLQRCCRVIELDVYNQESGYDGPVCKHGGTLTKPVSFKDCVAAISKHAFEKSPYPVIITIENHTDPENQKKMAEILLTTLGDQLYVPEPDEDGKPWKSPAELVNKVLIRTNASKASPELKRLVYISNTKFKTLKEMNDAGKTTSSSFDEAKARKILLKAIESSGIKLPAGFDPTASLKKMLTSKSKSLGNKSASGSGAGNASGSFEMDAIPGEDIDEEAINSVHSLAELYAYTANNLMRVYPGGLRVDSSNYNPSMAWAAGASFAALNWQVWDQPLWINSALFERNMGCGYVLKPSWMLEPLKMRESNSGVVAVPNPLPPRKARTLSVHVMSAYVQQSGKGKFACWKDDIYVMCEVWGMPQDNSQQRSHTAHNTGRLLVNKTYQFKVLYPEVAVLLIKIMDEDVPGTETLDDILGHWEISLMNLTPGEYKITMHDTKKQSRHDRWVKVRFEWLEGEDSRSTSASQTVANPLASNPVAIVKA